MITLRILNGFKRGASLPFDSDPVVVGSSLESDIILNDPGVVPVHFKIKCITDQKPDSIEIMPVDGDVTTLSNQVKSNNFVISHGEPFCISQIWFIVQQDDEEWPAQLPEFDTHTDSHRAKPKSASKRPSAKYAVSAFAIIAVLMGVKSFTYAKKTEDINSSYTKPLSTEATLSYKVADSHLDHNHEADKEGARAMLLARLRKMLSERELHDISVIENSNLLLELQGEMTELDKQKLSRMLIKFRYHYPDAPEVIDKTAIYASTLPFQISSVVTGPYGHLKLSTGEKMFIGQSFDGFRLVAINKNTIAFKGKKLIEVDW